MSVLMIALLLCTVVGILIGAIIGFVLGYDFAKSRKDYNREDLPVSGIENMPKTKALDEWREDIEGPEG